MSFGSGPKFSMHLEADSNPGATGTKVYVDCPPELNYTKDDSVTKILYHIRFSLLTIATKILMC